VEWGQERSPAPRPRSPSRPVKRLRQCREFQFGPVWPMEQPTSTLIHSQPQVHSDVLAVWLPLPHPLSRCLILSLRLLTLPASRLSLPVLVAEPSSIPAPVANASRLLPRGRDARHVDSAASSSLPVLASAVAAANLTLSKLPDGRTPMLCAYAAC